MSTGGKYRKGQKPPKPPLWNFADDIWGDERGLHFALYTNDQRHLCVWKTRRTPWAKTRYAKSVNIEREASYQRFLKGCGDTRDLPLKEAHRFQPKPK